MGLLKTISNVERALIEARTPEESKKVEAMAAAGIAYAKEMSDFESLVKLAYDYILARRKTTELCLPYAPTHGGDRGINQFSEWQGNNDVTLPDFGFTKMQWLRRKRELEVSADNIEEYIDDCIVKHVEPTVSGLLRFKNPHISFNSGDNEWNTPQKYIDAARRVMGEIDLDPASSHLANQIVKSGQYYTIEDDGLSHDWNGRIWMNPPYASELIGKFCDKLVLHFSEGKIIEAIVLVNNATETNWFASLVSVSSGIVFSHGRVHFLMPSGEAGAPLQGQAFVYMGDNPDGFFKEFSEFGWGARIIRI